MDLYHSSLANRMNEVMQVLTVIATIFIPLTFIVGVYGMNFDTSISPWNMPELNWYWGYPAVWTVMLAVAGGLLFFQAPRLAAEQPAAAQAHLKALRFSERQPMRTASRPPAASALRAGCLLAVVFAEQDLPQADAAGRDFDQFVVVDVLQRHFQASARGAA